jgi:hypothetical protein
MRNFWTQAIVLSALLVAIGVISFAQQITVRDNASTTAPVDQVRVFGSGYTSVLAFDEIASPTVFADAPTKGAVYVQLRTSETTPVMRLSAKLDDGEVWFVDHTLGQ